MERAGLVHVALRDPGPGDELTFDDATTEWKVASRCHCRCGASGYRSHHVGYSGFAAAGRPKIGDRALPYLRRTRWIEGAGHAQ
jgi:hypothetical protein